MELYQYFKYGSCDCCGDTLTEQGDMIIKRQGASAKVQARYCKHCKILLDEN